MGRLLGMPRMPVTSWELKTMIPTREHDRRVMRGPMACKRTGFFAGRELTDGEA